MLPIKITCANSNPIWKPLPNAQGTSKHPVAARMERTFLRLRGHSCSGSCASLAFDLEKPVRGQPGQSASEGFSAGTTDGSQRSLTGQASQAGNFHPFTGSTRSRYSKTTQGNLQPRRLHIVNKNMGKRCFSPFFPLWTPGIPR